jgi:transcriptional regulator with XRE-family HTH domain
MDVKINSQFVIAERENRAWSQQYLADAAGLSLRTVQRIETRGTGSYESAKAIASCFGISVADLRVGEEPKQEVPVRSRAAKAVGSLVGASLFAGVATLFLGSVFAQQVLLDVGVTVEEQAVGETTEAGRDLRIFRTQLLLGDSEEMDLPLEGEFNLVIAPSILRGGKVLLSVKLYEHHDYGFELIGEPRVITAGGEEIEVFFPVGENPKRAYRIAIRPQIQ